MTRSERNAVKLWLRAGWAALVVGAMLALAGPASASLISRSGFEALGPAPVLRVLRDDRVATLEMDYDADDPWGQFWTMSGATDEDAGFLVSWWPEVAPTGAAGRSIMGNDGGGSCLNPDHFGAPLMAPAGAPVQAGARWLVTGNRRVQLQPLDNDTPYHVRVERIDAVGRISSLPAQLSFAGGDGTRVAALRTAMTYFDDFNRPLGAADERLWNNAASTSTDPRFNLFFINDQLHVHTLQGTRHDNTGDKSQTSQRFRKRVRIQSGVRRRIVFDMDTALSPRSVWYLDLNPVPTELTGHASFFDEDGALGLPAGILRLRAAGQSVSISLVDMQGASRRLAEVDLEELGRQSLPNVRRSYELLVGTDGVELRVDGRSAFATTYAPHAFAAGDYELLWVGFGYNTTKDAVPYYLVHWDNFGFDGPVVDPRTVHDYVTRIEGTDYRKSHRGSASFPTFTVRIPDDLRPVVAGATAEAWLVATYQMGDYSTLSILPGDFVRVNGAGQYPLPVPANNSVPVNPDLMQWGVPHLARIKLGDLVQGGPSPLLVGDNQFQFHADNVGLLNVHVEVHYPPGSAPAYTPPSAIHHVPLHAELPRVGPPARFQRIGATDVGGGHQMGADPVQRIAVAGVVPLNIEIGNRSWADWAPQLMHHPVSSTEVWSTGGSTGIERIQVFLRPVGAGGGPGQVVAQLGTARHAPAPQGRYALQFDSGAFGNGEYELFVQATTPSGLASHPSYGDELEHFDSAQLSGAYYPIQIRIQN
jgi:hypothetical protein